MRSFLMATAALSIGALVGCAAPIGDADPNGDSGRLSGIGGPCVSTSGCDFGLRCLQSTSSRVCVQTCQSSSECGSNLCNPVPGSSTGWCSFDDGGFVADDHRPPADDERAPSPGDDGAPPVEDDPADDPGDGWQDDDPISNPEPDPQPEPEPEPEPEPQQPCTFSPGGSLSRNQTVPALRWQGIYDKSGATRDFSFEEFACSPEFDDSSILIMVVGAGWCSACPDYYRSVNSQASQIEAAGGVIAYVEVEDSSYVPANHRTADQIISNYISRGSGFRIGDGATLPNSRAIYNSSLIQAYPQAIVIRRSDMKVVADQNSSNFMLDFPALARANGGGGGSTPPGGNNGGACTEETSEPNNAPTSPASIQPGSFDAGICGSDSDYYQVNVQGFWRMDLTFSHAEGDIDVFVWDVNNNGPVNDFNNRPVGSDSGDDNESFTHFGPSVVRVYGYEGARAAYTLTLTQQ